MRPSMAHTLSMAVKLLKSSRSGLAKAGSFVDWRGNAEDRLQGVVHQTQVHQAADDVHHCSGVSLPMGCLVSPVLAEVLQLQAPLHEVADAAAGAGVARRVVDGVYRERELIPTTGTLDRKVGTLEKS